VTKLTQLKGKRVTRRRDGAAGVVVETFLSVPSTSRPGVWGTTCVIVRLDDLTLRQAAGGDMTGDASWFRSNFKEAK
jgi:hypothetical protein